MEKTQLSPSPISISDELTQHENELFSLFHDFFESLGPGKLDLEDKNSFQNCLNKINTYLPKIYQTYDHYLNQWILDSKVEPKCEKSCSNCCSHYVSSVEPFELIYLTHRWINKPNYSRLLTRLYQRVQSFQKASKGFTSEEDEALFNYLKLQLPCPFLTTEGACGSYKSRPMPCRMFYSLSQPSLCLAEGSLTPQNQNFIIELPMEIEIQIARISHKFSNYQFSDHFFEGLLQINEIVGKHYS